MMRPIEMKRILVKVTADHINSGTRLDSCDCPTALAIADKTDVKVDVLPKYVIFCSTGHSISPTADLPRRARRFIKRFDAIKPVKPFNFYLMVPA